MESDAFYRFYVAGYLVFSEVVRLSDWGVDESVVFRD